MRVPIKIIRDIKILLWAFELQSSQTNIQFFSYRFLRTLLASRNASNINFRRGFTKVHVHLFLTLHASYKYTVICDYIYSIDYWDK
ncbi:hypothetical protein RhiirC2_283867 [Rhizophagus irregularis]|uniref:Uncharacterized protein n=1 Tax=Rhizophagus irregularis TaxID=588596 RepID=A0A2N1MDC5_9GLOM|nr:hypothetical protein RhiirC2_283867 [Rhizophagus irregularis]